MIGPHTGRELELMLNGQKHLAVFCEAMVPGEIIPETVIPEISFKAHLLSGKIKRFSRDFSVPENPYHVRYVCFTTIDNEWRAEAFFWLHQEGIAKRRPFDDAYEMMVGRLLGYTENDIQDFLEHKKLF